MKASGTKRARKSSFVFLIGSILALAAAYASAAGVSTEAGPEGPAQIAYAPASGPAPVVVLLSGQSGPARYQNYAEEISRLGYHAVLLDGKDILTREQDGAGNLRKAIERAQRSPQSVPGKVAVIGFSQGGGGALAHASGMTQLVSMVVAYYPATSWAKDPAALTKRFQVPMLVLAAERDRYQNCCLIDSMRAMDAAAKERGAKFELVVYPEADHGFNIQGREYRRDDERDAWRRTTEMLRTHHPLR